MSEIQRMSVEEVLQVRRRMAKLAIATQDAFGETEPLHFNKLASAVFRQETSSGNIYKYPTVHENGATLFYGIAMSHAFENGNKRTALVSFLVYLEKNKCLLVDATEDDLYELARSVAAHDIPIAEDKIRDSDSEVAAIAQWIESHMRGRVLGDVVTKWKDVRAKLESFGCTFDKSHGNFMKIRLGPYTAKVGHPRANFDMQVPQIKDLRRKLHLDEIHGVDSAGFYELDSKVDEIVNGYRNLMKRLADL